VAPALRPLTNEALHWTGALPGGPEDKAREEIDRQLEATGWVLQYKNQLNLGAGVGVAVQSAMSSTIACATLRGREISIAASR
jgi:hypothetical protein